MPKNLLPGFLPRADYSHLSCLPRLHLDRFMQDGSAKETDQVMQEKLEASGFIPGWFTRLRDTSRDGIRNDREVNTRGLFFFFCFFLAAF